MGGTATPAGGAEAAGVDARIGQGAGPRSERVREAKIMGFEGDPCSECGNFTLVRNGTCLKCVTCGTTSGCS